MMKSRYQTDVINRCTAVLLALVIPILLINACIMDYTNHLLSIHNNSNVVTSVLYTNGNNDYSTENNVAFYTSEWNVVKPDSTTDITIGGDENAWHDYIQQGKSKKLSIYIFNVDTLKKYDGAYSMHELSSMHKYLKKMELTEQDLINCNWKLLVNDKE